MAIVKMNKITLAAPQNQKEDILNFIQTEESVHIMDLAQEEIDFDGVEHFKESSIVSDAEVNFNQIKVTYEFLKSYNKQKKGLLDKKEVLYKEEFDRLEEKINWNEIYKSCKEIEDGINQSKADKSKTLAMLEAYSQWTNFDVDLVSLDAMRKVTYFIGVINNKYEASLYEELGSQYKDIYIERISEKQQEINLFVLCHRDDSIAVAEILKKYGFSRSTLDFKVLSSLRVQELKARLVSLEEYSKELNERALELSENISSIEKIYDYYSVKLEKENSISKLLKTNETFIMQGWVFANRVDEFEQRLTGRFGDVYILFEEPSEEEDVPIALKNNPLVEPFETITELYSLPVKTEIDPTPVIAPFFMFFFGMMMADIGYGALMLAIGLFAIFFVELDGGTKKMVKLLIYCSIPTIIFGFLYGSFFGGIIPMTPIWIDPVKKPMDVLIWSMVFGLVHLFTGLGVKGYQLIKAGKIFDAIFDVVFWYMLILGLVLMFVAPGTVPKVVSIVGAVGLIATQGRANPTIVGKFFGGLYGLYGITGYLGDTLSYSRLLALGLATSLIGWAFNLLITLIKGPALFIAGPLIFVAGHSFNFAIGLLGTFVHTCRLQYLEFFGKFYEGGGKPYTPFKVNTKFINIKKS